MPEQGQYVVFTLDEQSYCLYLSCVEKVIHVVDTASLPKAPEIVTGVLNLNGDIIPVVNIRKRFRLPERDLNLSDQLIIAHTTRRMVAILVDSVAGVIECPSEKIVEAEEILPNTDYVAGIIKRPDGMILIHDLDTFLSLEEEKALGSAIDDFGGKV